MRVWIRISPFVGALTVLSLLWLVYWSWCWGWWGRNNLWLQYFFQCACPSISEQARFPTQSEVLVSGCQDESTKQAILSQMLNAGFVGGYHIAKNWWIGRSVNDYVIVNPTNGSFAVPKYTFTQGVALDPTILELIQKAKNVYWQQDLGILLALSSMETPGSGGSIVLTSQDDTPLSRELLRNQISLELSINGTPYDTVGSWGTVISRNRLFLYRGGIRLVAGDKLIVDGSELAGRFFAVGWAESERGALLEGNNSLYLYGGGFQVVVPTGPVVPQPILLLRVPVEYLPPHVRAEMKAQIQQEQLVRTLGNLSVLLSLSIAVLLGGLVVLRRTRRLPR